MQIISIISIEDVEATLAVMKQLIKAVAKKAHKGSEAA